MVSGIVTTGTSLSPVAVAVRDAGDEPVCPDGFCWEAAEFDDQRSSSLLVQALRPGAEDQQHGEQGMAALLTQRSLAH